MGDRLEVELEQLLLRVAGDLAQGAVDLHVPRRRERRAPSPRRRSRRHAGSARRLARAASRVVHARAHVLVEPPGDDAGGRRAEHEEARGSPPTPRGCRRGCRRSAARRPERPVLHHDVADRETERQPVLVEREHGDHHEEVEVRLDPAVPGVDQHGRRGQQAEHHRHRPRPPVRGAQHPRHARPALSAPPSRTPSRARLAARQREHRQDDDVRPEDPEHRAMTPRPGLLRQRLPARERLPHRGGELPERARRCRRVEGIHEARRSGGPRMHVSAATSGS